MDIRLYQLSPTAYAVISPERYDVGNLFFCVQEYYESSNPHIKGKRVPREQLMRMYALSMSTEGVFTYSNDWCGFNIPSYVLDEYYDTCPSNGMYDIIMWRIKETIRHRQSGPYYLIGVTEYDTETLHHELAHIMYATNEAYKRAMDKLIDDIDKDTLNSVHAVMRQLGYCDDVHKDELQANFATGLTNHFVGFDYLCYPFEAVFNQYNKPLDVVPVDVNVRP